MEKTPFTSLLEKQRDFFFSGKTLPVGFRKEMLAKLKKEILAREKEILSALYLDLGKSEFEAYTTEIGNVLTEISYFEKHLSRWTKPKKVKTALPQFPAKCYTLACPLGNTLIMSPWNYPFLLTLDPLIAAIGGGNTALVKPSAYAPNTAKCIRDLLSACFPEEYIATVLGGREENRQLLSEKFDFIFFTGSQTVGKEVLRHAAEHLTPAVLELGGKSPVIVDSSADIPLTARRIIFGKLLNCGQTCVAPDYVLCEKSVEETLLSALQAEIRKQYGDNPLECENYGKIISEKHFDRIVRLMDREKTVCGGGTYREKLKIAPTLLRDVTWEDPVMQEEIFGPVLPVLTYNDWDSLFPLLQHRPKPLALYLFSRNKSHIREVTEKIPFGGGCINDTILHLATSEMGFGGVGESGMGAYHGEIGFSAFTHKKSMVKKSAHPDFAFRYSPYPKDGFLFRAVKRFFR